MNIVSGSQLTTRFYFHNTLSLSRYLEVVVNALPENCNNSAVGGTDHNGIAFLKGCETEVVEEIADEFRAAHSERTKTVADTPSSERQRHCNFVGIKLNDAFYVFVNNEILRFFANDYIENRHFPIV